MANFLNKNVPYSVFSKPSKQDWIEKILSELKKENYEQLLQSVEEDLKIEPAYHNSDTSEKFLISPYPQWKKFVYTLNNTSVDTDFLLQELETEGIFIDFRTEKFPFYKILLKTPTSEISYEDRFSATFFLENPAPAKQNIFFADLFAEAGLTAAQQLALIIFVSRQQKPSVILWTTDDRFLISIAKILAFHKYFQENNLPKPGIWIKPELNILTRKLPHTNLIRITTASFAASVCGSNAIVSMPFNLHTGTDKEGLRLAANTLNILQYETGLRNLENPLAGTYALEILSSTIKKQAENYLTLLQNNYQKILSQWIKAGIQKQQTRKTVKIGANKYLTDEETPKTFVHYHSNTYSLIPYGIFAENEKL